MLKNQKNKLLSIIGAFLLHVTVGTIHTLPSISHYFYSYLIEYKEGAFSYTYIEVIISLVNLVHNIFLPVGVLLMRYYSVTTVIGLSIILIIFTKTIFAFFRNIILITIGFFICSVGCGLGYMPPIICLWKHYPKNKGLMTGLALSGFGFNRLLFKYISLVIINPSKTGLLPSKDTYPHEINQNFKKYLEISLIFFSIISVFCIFLIHPHKEKQRKIKNNLRKLSDNNEKRYCSLEIEQSSIKYYRFESCDETSYISYISTFIMDDGLSGKSFESISSLIVSFPFLQLTFIFFFAMGK